MRRTTWTARGAVAARVALGLLLVAGATGCAGDLPPPVLRSVTPSQFDQGRAPALLLEVEAVLPFRADHGSGELAVDETLIVRIAGLESEAALAAAPGHWHVVAPFDLPPGLHDVEIVLADGRSAVLPRSIQVREVVLPEGFTIDAIDTQRRAVPFAMTVRATGAAAPMFTGVVRLSTNRGTISPEVSDAFVNGVLTEVVTLNQVGSDVVISVEGPNGMIATSNTFRVNP